MNRDRTVPFCLCMEGMLDKGVVGHLLLGPLACCEELTSDGVVPGLQIFHAPGLALWCLHSSLLLDIQIDK